MFGFCEEASELTDLRGLQGSNWITSSLITLPVALFSYLTNSLSEQLDSESLDILVHLGNFQ